MKQATTPYSIEIQKNAQITREFLLSKGWRLIEDKPLYESFEHTKNPDLNCSISLYGGFSLVELHWCNKTPEKTFSTINPNLTIEDYDNIINLMNIKI